MALVTMRITVVVWAATVTDAPAVATKFAPTSKRGDNRCCVGSSASDPRSGHLAYSQGRNNHRLKDS